MDWEELARRVWKTLQSETCVKAGWAFGVPQGGQDLWLDLVTRAVVHEVAQLMRETEQCGAKSGSSRSTSG